MFMWLIHTRFEISDACEYYYETYDTRNAVISFMPLIFEHVPDQLNLYPDPSLILVSFINLYIKSRRHVHSNENMYNS